MQVNCPLIESLKIKNFPQKDFLHVGLMMEKSTFILRTLKERIKVKRYGPTIYLMVKINPSSRLQI